MLFPVLLGSIYDLVLEAAFGNAPIREVVFKIIGPVITLPFSILIFFVIYYLVPHGQVAVKQVLFTSVAMAILWVVATLIYRLALPLFDFEESYRGLASLMALITWVFITSFILILGANLSVREVVPKTWTGLLPFRLKAKADAARKDEQASMMSPNLPGH
ncbi:MAG TPA: YhjD/YihY/BrkB family envelope integrity protein [Blastocatellia bacterium]|nr:YhjD/YihY/BrkB family envelope integrity protein [Blastocatellia bacterium]